MYGSLKMMLALGFSVILFVFAGGVASADEDVSVTSAAGEAYGSAEEVDGVFRLTLDGEMAEGYSFYTEVSFGSGSAMLCTTDPELIGAGFTKCVPGTMEATFTAPAGEEVSYRILGNPGNELSQFVVAEGRQISADGMVIEGGYSFPAATPQAPQDDRNTPGTGAAGTQYGNVEEGTAAAPGGSGELTVELQAAGVPVEAVPEVPETPPIGTATSRVSSVEAGSDVAKTSLVGAISPVSSVAASPVDAIAKRDISGLLPDSGGSSVALLVGGALLLAVGGLLVRRIA